MRLIRQDILDHALKRHSDARQWICDWVDEVNENDWHNLEEMRKQYPSADGVRVRSGGVITVFNVKGNRYRLLTTINYVALTVQVRELITHAEYSKALWKERY